MAQDLHETLRDEDGPNLSWWESTPAEGRLDQGTPQIASEGPAQLLGRHGHSITEETQGPRYAVAHSLGRGAGGTVWAAHDQRLDRPVAIKVMARPAGSGDPALRAFLGEARIAASLHHPNVLAVHDLEVSSLGDPCFVMQRLEGRTLGDVLRGPGITDFNHLVSVFIGIGQALAYAHHHGVIHRDVKPDNVLLGDFGEVILVDWGCAVRGSASGGRLTGTPIYMAPEQARCEHTDARSDVYAFGATLFHALIGRPPQQPGDDAAAFWERKRRGDYDQPSESERRKAPPALVAIALKALSADPDQRYVNAQGLVDDLRHFQGGFAVSAWRDSPWSALLRWYRRHRTETWTGIVASMLVVFAAWSWWQEKQRETASWRLVMDEDFSDATQVVERFEIIAMEPKVPVPEDHQVVSLSEKGRASLVNGRLEIGQSNWVVNAATKQHYLGDVRAEWTASAQWGPNNLNCFIGASRAQGYVIHVGGWDDSAYCALTRGAEVSVIDQAWLEEPLQAGRDYHFTLERSSGHLRFAINDKPVFDLREPDDDLIATGQAIGFDCWSGYRQAIDNVRIWTRPLPERVSPLEAAEAVIHAGEPLAALRMLDDLADAYPQVEPGISATFRAAILRVEAHADQAEAQAVTLISRYPQHPQVPWLWYALHRSAQSAGDYAGQVAAREGLLPFPGHPVRRRVLREIGQEFQEQVRLTRRNWNEPVIDPQFMTLVESVAADLIEWTERYQEGEVGNSLITAAATGLTWIGRSDVLQKVAPSRSGECQRWHLQCGNFEELRQRWSYIAHVRREVVEATEDWRSYVNDTNETIRELARYQMGMVDELPKSNYVRAVVLKDMGRLEDIAADVTLSGDDRADALIALGRLDEAEQAIYPSDSTRFMRIDLARHGAKDLLETWPDTELVAYAVILDHLRQGRDAEAREVLQQAAVNIMAHDRVMDVSLPVLMAWALALDGGDVAQARSILEAACVDVHNCGANKVWFTWRLALGACDDQEFTNQPDHRTLEERRALGHAIAAELVGNTALARTSWEGYLAARALDDAGNWLLRDFARWRLNR